MLALVKAVVDCAKYVLAKNTNGWVTQVVVWGAGVGTTFLFAASDFGDEVDVAGIPLGTAASTTVILAGLGLGSAAMLANDLKQAIDASDSAVKPPLVNDTSAGG